jgi:hypothetical protein
MLARPAPEVFVIVPDTVAAEALADSRRHTKTGRVTFMRMDFISGS